MIPITVQRNTSVERPTQFNQLLSCVGHARGLTI